LLRPGSGSQTTISSCCSSWRCQSASGHGAAAFEPDRAEPVTARDLVHRTPVALVPQDNLETALRLCEASRDEHVPVINNGTDRKVIGEVRHSDLVLAYNHALLEARAAERGES
jgi:CIC family chloride channel protein